MVELAKTCQLDFEPGTRTEYSSGGYSVLARVLELASNKSYEQLLEEKITQPLGLKSTFHPAPGIDLREKNAARSYVWTLSDNGPRARWTIPIWWARGRYFPHPGIYWKSRRP